MNEYVRLAREKQPEARNYTELFSACFALPEEDAKRHAEHIEQCAEWEECLNYLERARTGTASSKNYAVFIRELQKRKDKNGVVKEGLPVVRSMNDVVSQAVEIRAKNKEHLLAFFLNARQQLIAKEVISIGTLTASLAHPREIFQPAIGKAAAGVILVHNHPSGDPSPSDEDVRLTKRISQAGYILGIDLLDHLIVARDGCYSFKQAGAL